jgi:hypothetical protein
MQQLLKNAPRGFHSIEVTAIVFSAYMVELGLGESLRQHQLDMTQCYYVHVYVKTDHKRTIDGEPTNLCPCTHVHMKDGTLSEFTSFYACQQRHVKVIGKRIRDTERGELIVPMSNEGDFNRPVYEPIVPCFFHDCLEFGAYQRRCAERRYERDDALWTEVVPGEYVHNQRPNSNTGLVYHHGGDNPIDEKTGEPTYPRKDVRAKYVLMSRTVVDAPDDDAGDVADGAGGGDDNADATVGGDDDNADANSDADGDADADAAKRVVDGSAAASQSPINPTQSPSKQKRSRKRKQGTRNTQQAKKKEGGARLFRNPHTPAEGGSNERKCLVEAVEALLPAVKQEQVQAAMIQAMPASGDTKVEHLTNALAGHGLSLKPVSGKYRKKGSSIEFQLLQERECKLVVHIALTDHNGDEISHFVAWDGKVITDKPLNSRVNNTTDRTNEKKSKLAFGKLFPKSEFASWQITAVYELRRVWHFPNQVWRLVLEMKRLFEAKDNEDELDTYRPTHRVEYERTIILLSSFSHLESTEPTQPYATLTLLRGFRRGGPRRGTIDWHRHVARRRRPAPASPASPGRE